MAVRKMHLCGWYWTWHDLATFADLNIIYIYIYVCVYIMCRRLAGTFGEDR